MNKPKYSTDDLKLTQFDAHGSVSLEIDARVLRMRAHGPFNREFMETMAVMERPVFSQMAHGGAWVEIVEFARSTLATADALALFSTHLQQLKAEGIAPIATAFVLDESLEGATIMRECYAAAYALANWPCAFFPTDREAEAWARQMLASAYTG